MKKILILLFAITCYINIDAQNANTSVVLPPQIKFDREVVQQMLNDETGKMQTITYYFTINGDYAGMKRDKGEEDEEEELVIYLQNGSMLMFDDKKKVITVMQLHKILGEGAQAGKETAEKISRKPLRKENGEKLTATATGKTKIICGYTAYEYEVKNEKGSSNWYYAKVDFNPVKIYTMGIGNSMNVDKIKDNPALKNNPMAIPVINQNYLMAEIGSGGKAGLVTKSISSKTTIVSTAGYKVVIINGIKDMLLKSDSN